MEQLGEYGRLFGGPEFQVTVSKGGRIAAITVLRGAPCGATWSTTRRVIGLFPEEAAIHIGLHVQYSCTADPAGWNVVMAKVRCIYPRRSTIAR